MGASRIFSALVVLVGCAGAHAALKKEEVQAGLKEMAARKAAAPAFLWGNQGQKLEGGRVPVRRSTLEAHDGYAPEGMSGYNSEPAAKPSNVAPNGETDAMIEHYFQRRGLEGFTCEILAASGGCDGGGDEYAYMCPVTCGQPLGWGGALDGTDHFCNGTDNDGLMSYHLYDYYNTTFDNFTSEAFMAKFADETGEVTCAGVASAYKDTKEFLVYANGDTFSFCEEPFIASVCHTACGTNCWDWPPKKSTQVYMPSCGRSISIPTSTHLLMRDKKQASGDPGVGCSA